MTFALTIVPTFPDFFLKGSDSAIARGSRLVQIDFSDSVADADAESGVHRRDGSHGTSSVHRSGIWCSQVCRLWLAVSSALRV